MNGDHILGLIIIGFSAIVCCVGILRPFICRDTDDWDWTEVKR